jgi:hypothetical protein
MKDFLDRIRNPDSDFLHRLMMLSWIIPAGFGILISLIFILSILATFLIGEQSLIAIGLRNIFIWFVKLFLPLILLIVVTLICLRVYVYLKIRKKTNNTINLK